MQEPAVSSDGEVEFIRSAVDGVFLPLIEHNHYVKKGDLIGEVVDPFEGTVKQQIRIGREFSGGRYMWETMYATVMRWQRS